MVPAFQDSSHQRVLTYPRPSLVVKLVSVKVPLDTTSDNTNHIQPPQHIPTLIVQNREYPMHLIGLSTVFS